MRTRRLAAVAVVATAATALGSCATLPSNTEPHVLRSFEPQAAQAPEIAPQPGSDPDLLLRDFFAALAVPTANYEAARNFLREGTREAWQPTGEILVVDRLNITTVAGGGAGRRAFSVQGNVIGEVTVGGVFTPARALYDATIELEQVDGEWRISSLPSGVVIERTELRNKYQPHNLYFYDPNAAVLVPDRRWIFAEWDSLSSVLLNLLIDGPSERLQPAVSFTLPADVGFTGFENGAYNFTGFGSVSEADRLRFAAQVVWVLAQAGTNGPISITADGDPLVPGIDSFTTDDFADVHPMSDAAGEQSAYALFGGSLFQLSGGQAESVAGPLGSSGEIVSADVNRAGDVAVVAGQEGNQRLELGKLPDPLTEVATAGSFTRPTFEMGSAAVWVVADGTRVLRAVRSAATGEVSASEVNVDLPEGVEGNMSVLRLSQTGARAVLVIDGHLYTGVVAVDGAGARRLVNVIEYAPDLGGSVIAADWNLDGSLLVGTNSAGAPVVRVEQDGSSATVLSSGNLTAPVVAVASSGSMYFATDANGTLQLPSSGTPDNPNWREVPGLQGVRSLPIVAR
ncbi:LpqB family beta-propeller domain-containing protein [Corynebacterium auris]|uniref:LpqB family beta-propeller domain-containing protein n=1 Tax=Corynebacterium auris TaxID=44750 RepID=UPI0025B45381|nr:LpqB family beta-propeller domain-containing protein [Corynebacterium auris]WJY67492.1 Lipoprotein LpqB precursor [Corynebacterium auris]